MKFNCGLTYKEKVEAKEQWHKSFVWWPIRIGSRDCRWLETVERRGTLHEGCVDDYWTWEYRSVNDEV